jgi:hypothetical protein
MAVNVNVTDGAKIKVGVTESGSNVTVSGGTSPTVTVGGGVGPQGATGPPGTTAWAGITGKPSTVAGYGISDAVVSTDARLADAREWSAETVPQAEAEAGAATARRAWTAERVRQAVVAWWSALSVPIAKVTGLQAALDAKAATDSPTFTNTVTFVGDDSSTSTINGATAAFASIQFTVSGSIQNTAFTNTLKTKLDGIATGATANATDAALRDRATHTGTQDISTIASLQSALDGKAGSTHPHVTGDVSTTATGSPLSAIDAFVDACAENGYGVGLVDILGGVIDTDSRLTDARTPLAHKHSSLSTPDGSSDRVVVDAAGRVLVGLAAADSVPNTIQCDSLVVAGLDIIAGGQVPSFVSRGSCWIGSQNGSKGCIIATTTGPTFAITGLNYNTTAYNEILLQAGNYNQLFLATGAAGLIGVHTNTPQARLDVRGQGAATARTFQTANSSGIELLWTLDNGNQFSSSGRFTNAGDARFARYHARNTTTNTTATTNLFLNGSSTNITVSATSAYMFAVKVTAYSTTTNEAAVFFFRGGIRRNAASGTVLIGTVTKESWKEAGLTAADANVIADDSNETLRVQVNGLGTATIRWHAVIETSEVSFGAQ